MAEGILKSLDPELAVFSAGTKPAEAVHPKAIAVMQEIGINLHNKKPQNVSHYLNQSFDYVITVCDNAKETCPIFYGKVNELLHISFVDPADASGTEEEILQAFRTIRDEITVRFRQFYHDIN
jgi:arsenate reductase